MIFDKDKDEDKKDEVKKDEKQAEGAAKGAGGPEFGIKGIYIRDLSFEAPNPPGAQQGDWQPDVKFELNTQARKVDGDDFEVILKLTVTVKVDKKVAFIAEAQQGGLFTLRGFNDEQRGQMLGSFCPNVLYPYARELVSNIATRGGYPPLYLAPVNFDALYQDHLSRVQQAAAGGAGEA
jgi:preprotein translocase subunit SecB